MNLVDVILVVGVAAAVVAGLRAGLVGIVAGVVGTAGGFFLGALLVPPVARLLDVSGGVEVFVASAVLVTVASAVMTVVQIGAFFLAKTIDRARLGRIDHAGGAVVAFFGALLVAWLIGGLLATAPSVALARSVQHSSVLRALDDRFPATPAVVARVQSVLLDSGMPLPFAGFEPNAGSAPEPASADVAAAQKAAAAASVKVSVAGCGRGVTGSGVVVGADLVLTNAHVVAGGRNMSVRVGTSDRAATPVLFDPDVDIAVLRVERLDVKPLPIAESNARTGAGAAVLGYPGGRGLTVSPATVLARQRALGRDIWGGDLVTRDVYVLQADVRPGDSGGPFVDATGTVLGLVFARSLVHDGVGYALDADELRDAVDHAGTTRVATGSCVP